MPETNHKPTIPETPKKQPAKRLPHFTPEQKIFIRNLFLEGYENKEVTKRFKKKYFPHNGFLTNAKEKKQFSVRLSKIKYSLNKNKIFKELSKQAKQGLANKDHRLNFIKKQISTTLDVLDQVHARLIADIENPSLNDIFLKHKKQLFSELKHLAIEMNEYKTTSFNVNVDNRDQRKLIYAGQAVLPELDKEKLKELKVVEVPSPEPAALPKSGNKQIEAQQSGSARETAKAE